MRRDSLSIKGDLLQKIADGELLGIKPTVLMVDGNISWRVLTAFLDELIADGLVSANRVERAHLHNQFNPYIQRQHRKRFRYSLTGRGYSVLKHYLVVKEALGPKEVKRALGEEGAE